MQLPKTKEEDQGEAKGGGGGSKGEEENKAGFAVFTHFSEAPLSGNQNSGNSNTQGRGKGVGGGNRNNREEKKVPSRWPKVQTSSGTPAPSSFHPFLLLIALTHS